MRFDTFPLDTQYCKFQVGSYSYDMTKMNFTQTNKVQGYAMIWKDSNRRLTNFLSFVKTANSVVLDYKVDIIALGPSDFVLNYGELGNFSVAGFEMRLRRHVSHYLITYYLPSGDLNTGQAVLPRLHCFSKSQLAECNGNLIRSFKLSSEKTCQHPMAHFVNCLCIR